MIHNIKRFNETNLYHGSHYDIKGYIEPKNNSYENGDYVFATNDRSFALCYSGNPWHDDIINQSYYNGQLVITEMKPGYLDKVFNTDGYILIDFVLVKELKKSVSTIYVFL